MNFFLQNRPMVLEHLKQATLRLGATVFGHPPPATNMVVVGAFFKKKKSYLRGQFVSNYFPFLLISLDFFHHQII